MSKLRAFFFLLQIPIIGCFFISLILGREDLIAVFLFAFLIDMIGTMIIPSIKKELSLGSMQANIERIGIQTIAEVMDVNPRGGGNENSPGVTIMAKVHYPDCTEKIVPIETTVSVVYLPRLIPGNFIDVKYDPNDQEKVVMISFKNRNNNE